MWYIFSILVDKDSQYLFAFTWEGWKYIRTVVPQGFAENPSYFSQILGADLDGRQFSTGSTLL